MGVRRLGISLTAFAMLLVGCQGGATIGAGPLSGPSAPVPGASTGPPTVKPSPGASASPSPATSMSPSASASATGTAGAASTPTATSTTTAQASPAATATATAAPGTGSSPAPGPTGTGATTAVQSVKVGTKGNEPILAEAPDGTLYIAALTNLYRSPDGGATFQVAPPPAIAATVLASDSSIDVAPGGRLYYTFDYPYAGTTAVCTSDDRGNTWTCDPAVAPGGTDRMWITAPGDNEAYETTNEGLYQTAFFDSTDGGMTWTVRQAGNNVLQPTTGPLTKIRGSNVVLQVLDEHPGRFVYRYLVSAPGVVPALADTVSTGVASGQALPSSAQDSSGAYYLVGEAPNATGGLGVQIGRSTDQGQTYSLLPMIPQTTSGTVSFTNISTGAPGHLAVIYYSSLANGMDSSVLNAPWSAQVAETYDAFDAIPIWTVTTLEAVVHTGGVCASAGCTGDTRYSGDTISALIDKNGHLNLTWMDEPAPALTPTVRFARLH